MKKLFSLFFFSTVSYASIFGVDDRVDFHEIKEDRIKELSKSLPGLVLKDKVEKLANGDFRLIGKSIKAYFNFCDEANFSSQPFNANCSSTLIDSDKILTAAHCIDENDKGEFSIHNYYVVFDYKKEYPLQTEYIIPKENVFEIEKKLHFDFDPTMGKSGLDLAVLKLKRKTSRKPIKLNFNPQVGDDLVVLGYPLGVPQKKAEDGRIGSINNKTNSFRHDLDTFSCNSGSGIINLNTLEVIGVHVRGTGTNYKKYGKTCNDWQIADPEKDFGEANDLKSLKGKF